MATIYNSTDYTFSPSAQQSIQNAAANMGIDEVYAGISATDGGNGTLFDLFNEADSYLFSIDTDQDVIFEK